MNMYSYLELLKKFYTEYEMDSKKLSQLTNIPTAIIDHDPDDFTQEFKEEHMQEYAHLSTAFAFLSEKCQIDEDAYVRSHMKNFIDKYGVSVAGISKFIEVDLETLKDFLAGQGEITLETRYKMAVRFLSMEWLLTKNPFVDI